MYRVWKGPKESAEFDGKWNASIKTQAYPLMQAMDEDVHVEQLMDDLFLPPNNEDPNVETTKWMQA